MIAYMQRRDPPVPEFPQEYHDKTLLLVGTGGIKRRPVLEALRASGLRQLIILHDEVNWAKPYANRWIDAPSVGTGDAALTALFEFQRTHPAIQINGVYTYDEYSVVVAARLAEALGLPGISPQVALSVRDKYAMRETCRAHGLPAPGCLRIRDVAQLAPEIDRAELAYPLVLKPVRGAGSTLVQRVENAEELTRTAARFQAELQAQHLGDVWGDSDLQVEEYIAGHEVDIDILLFEGEVRYAQVSDNFPPVEPWFLERGGRLPSLLSTMEQQRLIEMASAILRVLNVFQGCVHFEARLGANGPIPIEINLRLGGAEIFSFHWAAFRVHLLEQAVRIALGLAPTVNSFIPPRTYCTSTNFIPPQSGRIRNIQIDPNVLASPYSEELVIFRDVGDTVRLPPAGFDYCGWMVASGDSPDASATHLAELVNGVRFDIAP